MALGYDRWCAEIVAQTDLLRAVVRDADVAARVPSCPGWSLDQLLRHVGGEHRRVETIVRTRAERPPPEEQFNDVSGFTGEKPEVLDSWLAEGAARLAETLRAAGPDTRVWTPTQDGTSAFWARRMAHETVVHRFDACHTCQAEYAVDVEVAVDAIDEWMDSVSQPHVFEARPGMRDLIGPGRTLRFHATDQGGAAAWLVDLTSDTLSWRRSRDHAAVTVNGPLIDLLLALYQRPGNAIDVHGEAPLFHAWRDNVGFWLHE